MTCVVVCAATLGDSYDVDRLIEVSVTVLD